MDQSSGKKGPGFLVARKKGHGVSLRDGVTEEGDRNAQFCNRIGCSGRVKYAQDTKMRSSFHSSDENETRKFSRSTSLMASAKKSALDSKRKFSSQSRFDRSESSLSDKSEFLSSTSSVAGNPSESQKDSGKLNLTESRNCIASSSLIPQKKIHQKAGSKNQKAMTVSPTPLSSRSSALQSSNTSEGGRFGQRNLKLYSVSDSIPSCSSQEPESSGKKMKKKRSSEAGSSFSSGGRKTSAAPYVVTNCSPSTNGITISGSRGSGSASGEGGSGPSSFWTRRSMNTSTRTRLSCRQNGRNNSSAGKTPLGVSQIPDDDRHIDLGGQSLFDASSSRSYNLSRNNRDSQSARMPFTLGPMRFTPSTNQDILHQYDMGGAAEILLALERIEQDEELTHEQVLALEMSLFFGGLNLYDRHRDMRLDIDSMSYEELVALGDRMGTVSTPLSEEELSNCLKRSIYQDQEDTSTLHLTGSNGDGDDIKCCICQEEYVIGDEIGKLSECHHGYHEMCINQWLRLKNWCPICKTSTAPSGESSSF